MDIDFAFLCIGYETVTAETEQGPDIRRNAFAVGIDSFSVVELPATWEQLYLYFQTRASKADAGDEKTFTLRLIDADGNNIVDPEQAKVVIPKPRDGLLFRGQLVMGFKNIVFKEYGDYAVDLLVDGSSAHRSSFRVFRPG